MKLTRLPIFAALLFAITGYADEPLPKGEHVIVVPAIGDTLCVHNLFQSNMVIQRDKPIRVWGWATAGEEVRVSFAGQEQSAKADDDRAWSVELPAQTANSTPQQMTVQGKDKTLSLENVVIGDVWILGGQSNMEHPISRVEEGDLEIVSANYPNIRMLTVPAQNGAELRKGFPIYHEWSGWWGRHSRKGDWEICTPDTVRELSAIGYVFARRLHATAGIPIGVIDASRGGTTVEAWTPNLVLRKIDTPEVKEKLTEWDEKVAAFDPEADLENRVMKHEQWVANMKKQGKKIPADRKTPTDLRPGPKNDQNRPGNCYASMISPIAGVQAKGAIWHQGYNNALQPNGHIPYHQIFAKMIEAWRTAFNDPALPFGIISLCTAGAPQTLDNYCEKMVDEGVYIRAVQYQTYLDLVKAGDTSVGFASSYDMRRSWYHPGVKIPVGERIARWALATQYESKLGWKPPMLKETKIEDGKLLLTFDVPVGAEKDSPMLGFAVAGEDRRFQPATAEHFVKGKDNRNRPQYERRIVVLSSPHVPNPVHFRYAWSRNPMGNVTCTDARYGRAPLATQRSDGWKLTEVPAKLDEGMDHRAKVGQQRKLQKELDLERRLEDARALIDQHSEDK
jgi:sialate O-acetylesterase